MSRSAAVGLNIGHRTFNIQMGRWLIVSGMAMLVVGAILQFAPSLLSWFGKLPGDIHIESERWKIVVPLTSMVLVSLVVTLLINYLRR